MANTYVLIASNTLGSNTASVTFSSIPNTYTDLVVKTSTRLPSSGGYFENLFVELNANTGAVYSGTLLRGNGGTTGSARQSTGNGYFEYFYTNDSSTTSNTFSNCELYIPNYTASTNKPISSFSVVENNSATAAESFIATTAHLFGSTSAITSIKFYYSGGNIASGSSFFLYGIKNS